MSGKVLGNNISAFSVHLLLGSPSIVSLALNQEESALVCVSKDGPATTVIWKRDNATIQNDSQEYKQIQRVVDMETATYENRLISYNATNFVGTFTCMVSNVRGSSEQSLLLNGTLQNYLLSLCF